jgi:hypothetical protein
MANSAGTVPSNPNQGQTDRDRGSTMDFRYNKAGRNTGKVGAPSKAPNSNTEDGNKRTVNDPRLS